MGEDTVQHVFYHLPRIIQDYLLDVFKENPSLNIAPDFISDLISHAINSFDEAITADVLNLFPGGIESLSKYSDEEIQKIINDQDKGGLNYRKARLCMYGTTALVALVDPDRENLWVANVGDCRASTSTVQFRYCF